MAIPARDHRGFVMLAAADMVLFQTMRMIFTAMDAAR
jgi:hypothetical protein